MFCARIVAVVLCSMLVLQVGVPVSVAVADEVEPGTPPGGTVQELAEMYSHLPVYGSVEGTGHDFRISDNPRAITLRSTSPIRVQMDAGEHAVSVFVEGLQGALSSELTLAGLIPGTTYYKYVDDVREFDTLVADQNGSIEFDADLFMPVSIMLQTAPSTLYLTEEGWSNPLVGTWDPLARVASLSQDVYEQVRIEVDGAVLDGSGHAIIVPPSSDGVLIYRRNNVVVRDLRVIGGNNGVHLNGGDSILIDAVTVSGSAMHGILVRSSASGSRVRDCEVYGCSNGLYVDTSVRGLEAVDNVLQENTIYDLSYTTGSGVWAQTNRIEGNVGSGGLPIVYLQGAASLEDTTVAQLVLGQAHGSVVRDVHIEGSPTLQNNGVLVAWSADVILERVQSSANYFGIDIQDGTRVTIRDCDLQGNRRDGVLMSRSRECLADGVHASDNDRGVAIAGGSANQVRDSLIRNNYMAGVSFAETADALVADSELRDNRLYDLNLTATSDGSCRNAVSNVLGSGGRPIWYFNETVTLSGTPELAQLILADADGSIVEGARVTGSQAVENNGLLLCRTEDAVVSGLSASDCRYSVEVRNSPDAQVLGGTIIGGRCGVVALGSDRVVVRQNTLEALRMESVLLYQGSQQAWVEENTISGGGWGVYAAASANSVISGNSMSGMTYSGVLAAACAQSEYVSNSVSDSRVGLELSGDVGGTVRGNRLTDCWTGILVGSSSSIQGLGLITENVMTGNDVGLRLERSSGNVVYRNDFVGNTVQARSNLASNTFNLDRPVGGNHWSDWVEPDDDQDGFVDLPYLLSTGVDELPLSRPVHGQDVTAPTTSASLTPVEPDGIAGWYVTPPILTLVADDQDGSGVARTEYAYGTGEWVEYTHPFEVQTEGLVDIRFRSIDLAGNVEDVQSLTLRLDTQAPNLMLESTSLFTDEGSVAENRIFAQDALGQVVVEVSDGTVSYDPVCRDWVWQFAVVDGPADGRTVTVRAHDGHGNVSEETFELIAQNVAPTVYMDDVVVDPVVVGTDVQMTAVFVDPGVLDGHTASWDWGDGSVSSGLVDIEGHVLGSHVYSVPGVYRVSVDVIDSDGAVGSAVSEHYVVVYDPTAGWVTGGGWITSPLGAYALEPSLTGKASFGFVSKYDKGASVPKGQTQFQFRAGGFEFHSIAYDWLVVAGPKAQYKGVGRVGQEAGYGFMLTAVDGRLSGGGGVDRFRIKVWDSETGAVVYDNQMGAGDSDTPVTALGGGSIVIHK